MRLPSLPSESSLTEARLREVASLRTAERAEGVAELLSLAAEAAGERERAAWASLAALLERSVKP